MSKPKENGDDKMNSNTTEENPSKPNDDCASTITSTTTHNSVTTTNDNNTTKTQLGIETEDMEQEQNHKKIKLSNDDTASSSTNTTVVEESKMNDNSDKLLINQENSNKNCTNDNGNDTNSSSNNVEEKAVSSNNKEVINENTKQMNNTKKDNHTTRSNHTLKLKSQYILTERSNTLPALPAPVQQQRDDNDNTSKRNKKNRGRNKKRPRDAKPDPKTKICFEYLKDNEKGCSFGTNCKFSHDIQSIFNAREKDITDIIKCPNYTNFGYCPFSITCRVGAEHLDDVGNNLRNGNENDGNDCCVQVKKKEQCYKNIVSKDIIQSLRKNKFPFECQRRDNTKNGNKKQLKKEEKVIENFNDSSTPIIKDTTIITTVVDTTTPYPKKEMKLIDFSNKVYVAPLTTVGNLPFRRIMKYYQADITCSEMAVATSLLSGHIQEWALVKRHTSEDIFGIQIAAGHPDQYIRCCELLQHQRNENNFAFDFVDMNLGCPLDIICDKGAGAKLMTKSNKLRDIVTGMGKVLVDVPITIKMRTGWDESKPFAKELINKIIGWNVPNVSTFFVHGRSRLQRYSKLADWDYIEHIASFNTSEPEGINIVPNGDILTYTDYYDKLSKYPSLTPCAMLGRGALIKPWLPTEIKEKRHYDISSSERFDMLKQFVSHGLEHWGSDTQGVNTTRRFLLEWLSFLHRYIPVGMLDVIQGMNQRPPIHMCGRDDLETLMLSNHYNDWIKISEMLLGPVPDDFQFQPKHKANSYS